MKWEDYLKMISRPTGQDIFKDHNGQFEEAARYALSQVKEQHKTLREVVAEAASHLSDPRYLIILFRASQAEIPEQLTDEILLMFADSDNAAPDFIFTHIISLAPQLFGAMLKKEMIAQNPQHIQTLLNLRLNHGKKPLSRMEVYDLLQLVAGRKIVFDYIIELINNQPVIDEEMMGVIKLVQQCPEIANDQQAMRKLFLAIEKHPEFLYEGRNSHDLIGPDENIFRRLDGFDDGQDLLHGARQYIINSFVKNQQIGGDFIAEHVFGNCGITLTAGALGFALANPTIRESKQLVRALFNAITRHGQILPSECLNQFVRSEQLDADDMVDIITKQPIINRAIDYVCDQLFNMSPWAQTVMHGLVQAITRDGALKTHHFTVAKLSELANEYIDIKFIDPRSKHYCSDCLEMMKAMVNHEEYSKTHDWVKILLLQPVCLRAVLGNEDYCSQIAVADGQKISQALWDAMCAYCKHTWNQDGKLSPIEAVNLMIKVCLRKRNASLLKVFCEQAATAFSKMPPAIAEQIQPLLEKARAQMELLLQPGRAQKLQAQLTAAQAEHQRRRVDYAVLREKFVAICHVIDIATEGDLVAQLQHLDQLPATKLAAGNCQVALRIDGIFGCEQLPVLIVAHQGRIIVSYEAAKPMPLALQNLIQKALGGCQVEFVAMPLAELPIFKAAKPGPGNGGGQ